MVFSVNAYFAHLAKQFRKHFDTTLSHTQILTILAQGIGFESLIDFQKAELNDHSYSSIGQALPDYRGVLIEDGGYFFTNLGIDDDAWFTFLAASRRDKYAYVDAYLCDYLGGSQGVSPSDPEWEQWASQYPDQAIGALKKDQIKILHDSHFQTRKGFGATVAASPDFPDENLPKYFEYLSGERKTNLSTRAFRMYSNFSITDYASKYQRSEDDNFARECFRYRSIEDLEAALEPLSRERNDSREDGGGRKSIGEAANYEDIKSFDLTSPYEWAEGIIAAINEHRLNRGSGSAETADEKTPNPRQDIASYLSKKLASAHMPSSKVAQFASLPGASGTLNILKLTADHWVSAHPDTRILIIDLGVQGGLETWFETGETDMSKLTSYQLFAGNRPPRCAKVTRNIDVLWGKDTRIQPSIWQEPDTVKQALEHLAALRLNYNLILIYPGAHVNIAPYQGVIELADGIDDTIFIRSEEARSDHWPVYFPNPKVLSALETTPTTVHFYSAPRHTATKAPSVLALEIANALIGPKSSGSARR